MKSLKFLPIIFFLTAQQLFAQKTISNKVEIANLINKYSQSVIKKDSVSFYSLFNDGQVTWCGALKERSQAKDVEIRGKTTAGSNYFAGTYKGFLRSLYGYRSTEDKFDNIKIVQDGTVASVTMDYSFWADNKMTNWGEKYLTLVKRDGQWRITSVIYSVELTEYFKQPSLNERQHLKSLRQK